MAVVWEPLGAVLSLIVRSTNSKAMPTAMRHAVRREAMAVILRFPSDWWPDWAWIELRMFRPVVIGMPAFAGTMLSGESRRARNTLRELFGFLWTAKHGPLQHLGSHCWLGWLGLYDASRQADRMSGGTDRMSGRNWTTPSSCPFRGCGSAAKLRVWTRGNPRLIARIPGSLRSRGVGWR